MVLIATVAILAFGSTLTMTMAHHDHHHDGSGTITPDRITAAVYLMTLYTIALRTCLLAGASKRVSGFIVGSMVAENARYERNGKKKHDDYAWSPLLQHDITGLAPHNCLRTDRQPRLEVG
jgi:hypothetical protein